MSEPSDSPPTAPLVVGVLRETSPGERRVALVPAGVATLKRAGLEVVVERTAGAAAGFLDSEYADKGAEVVDREVVVERADVLASVVAAGACEGFDASALRRGQTLVASCDPLSEPKALEPLATNGIDVFALELVPRITRAQSMDVLSSMATIAGYKAVLLAADALPRMFPLMMTAAGTLKPARVFVIGAGVAGLQAIATAKRLGAMVSAYDLRPVVREQVESVGGRFVEPDTRTADAEGAGGYAKEMDEAFYTRQREELAKVCAEHDVVITTAAIPGRPSPLLVTEDAVVQMRPGSVIVDLAAERGGNCALTKADETVVEHDVTILGPTDLPSEVPYHASEMYSKNVVTFLENMLEEGRLKIDLEDQIVRDTLVTRDGEIVHGRIRELLGLPPLGGSGKQPLPTESDAAAENDPNDNESGETES